MMILTCHTDGCPNEGIPIEWDEPAPEVPPVTQATPWCGGCSTQFTDIRDAPGGS